MKKIFIRLDTQTLNLHLDRVNALSTALTNINTVLLDLLGYCSNAEIAETIINNGYVNFISTAVKNEELKLKEAKLAKFTISNICEDLKQALTEDLGMALAPVANFQSKDYLKYFGFFAKGTPFILDTAQAEISDLSSLYANTPKQIAFYNKHLEAVKMLNSLNAVSIDAFGHSIINVLTLFQNDSKGNIVGTEINYLGLR